MQIRYEYLTPQQHPEVFATFVEAFSDYVVDISYLTQDGLRNRWVKNAVDYGASIGAFDGDRLVGFTMLGVDQWDGRLTAFDAGTGVVKAYRGWGVAPGMFDAALEGLRARGVSALLLEVIQSNRPAVRTYRRLGFEVTREFECLQLAAASRAPGVSRGGIGFEVERVSRDLLPVFEAFADSRPSWETSFRALARIPDEVALYGARADGQWIGFAAYYPTLGWMMGAAVHPAHRRRGVATALLGRLVADLPGETTPVKLINVARSDTAMASWASRVGFESYALQYEMALAVGAAAADRGGTGRHDG